MAISIIMPKLGMAMKEGVIAKWNKSDGDPIRKDEEVAVVMSKKITYKLVAAEAGILRIVRQEQETLQVGEVLGFITAPGEALPDISALPVAEDGAGAPAAPSAASTPSAAAPSAAPGGFVLASPAARRMAKERGVDLGQVRGSGADGMVTEADVTRHLATPPPAPAPATVLATSAARKLAQERGIDLAQVRGSGTGGRVTEQDVLSFGAAPPAAPATPPALARIIPFAGMRQMIAENMVQSLQSMAQVSMMVEIDATELVKLRSQLKADFELTYTDLLVKAVAKTLKRHPILNATLIGDEIHLLDTVHIGVAVALPDGLIVPVLRDADRRTVEQIAQEARRLALAARDGSLGVDDATGATFTITNLGSYGIDGFTPIVNPPEVAILGVGRIIDKPVIHNDQIVRRATMVLSLTIDHRIVDGAPGASFLSALRELLESPYRLLV